jgi:tetratricopeptide (TPR) repeat protein
MPTSKKYILLLVFVLTMGAQNVSAKDTRSAVSCAGMGDQYRQSGRYRDAVVEYGKAIRLDKHNSKYYLSRGDCELSLGQNKKTIGDASKAIKINPTDPDAFSLRAKAFDVLKEYKKEKSDLDALMNLSPNGSTMLLRAQTKMHLKEYNSALDDLNSAINTGLAREQLSQLYYLRAEAYKKTGQKTRAEQELAKYNSLQP